MNEPETLKQSNQITKMWTIKVRIKLYYHAQNHKWPTTNSKIDKYYIFDDVSNLHLKLTSPHCAHIDELIATC